MAEKDFREKKLEDFDDVFADIINVLIFHGQQRVNQNDLDSGMLRSAYKVEELFEEQERDVSKLQLEPLPDFYPVVTLVLYFGDTHWKGSLYLKDHLSILEGLEEYVTDYKVNLFEIAFLSDEQVSLFQSDFRYVAEYFVGERKRKEGLEQKFTITLKHMEHVEEFIELMNAITNSNRRSGFPKMIKDVSGTIREAVSLSDPSKADDEQRIREALRIACAEEFVEEQSEGIDTLLGERGTELSEGQMQRIAIARAIFSGNPVLLLDEATSALDERTEAQLLKNLRRLTDKTVVIITHRKAAFSICDRVIRFTEEGDIYPADIMDEADNAGVAENLDITGE